MLVYSGNFGNLIDGTAPPPSKKKLEDVSVTTPLLDTAATMPCKSTTTPERPLFGDAQRCLQHKQHKFIPSLNNGKYLNHDWTHNLVCAGITCTCPSERRSPVCIFIAAGRIERTDSITPTCWTQLP